MYTQYMWTDAEWKEVVRILGKDSSKLKAMARIARAVKEGRAAAADQILFTKRNEIWLGEVEALAKEMDEAGIEKFLYASNCANFKKVLYRFQELGFWINGMKAADGQVFWYRLIRKY